MEETQSHWSAHRTEGGSPKNRGVDTRPFDLTQKPPANVPERPDVVFSFEVAEHMPDELGRQLVQFMASFRTFVIFSAAIPGQGGTGHINEQPDSYWIELFQRESFSYSEILTTEFRKQCTNGGAAKWFQTNPLVMLPIN